MTTYSEALFEQPDITPFWGTWPLSPRGPAVCVGNGPSLRAKDLDEIQLLNLDSFATNYIQLMYGKTVWRPTNWVACEILDTRWIAWHVNQGYECYITTHRMDKVELYRPPWRSMGLENLHYLPMCPHFRKKLSNSDRPKRLHLPRVCLYGSSGTVSVQLAMLFGYNPIVLLGHDCNLSERRKEHGSDVHVDPNHFDPEYDVQVDWTDGIAKVRTETWHDAHRLNAEAAEDLGIKIYNATRGGDLEAYERIDFDRIQEVLT